MYNTVVRLCHFFCCGGKVNFVRIPYSHDCFSEISRTFFVKKMIPYKTYVQEDQLFLALYGSTTIQSLFFLKNIENFVWFPKQCLLGFFILQKQWGPSFLLVCIYFLLCMDLQPYRDCFSKISRTFFFKKVIPYKTYVREDQLFLVLYGSTTIQSLLFLKNIKKLVLIS